MQDLLEALLLVEALRETEAGAGDRGQRLAPAHEVARELQLLGLTRKHPGPLTRRQPTQDGRFCDERQPHRPATITVVPHASGREAAVGGRHRPRGDDGVQRRQPGHAESTPQTTRRRAPVTPTHRARRGARVRRGAADRGAPPADRRRRGHRVARWPRGRTTPSISSTRPEASSVNWSASRPPTRGRASTRPRRRSTELLAARRGRGRRARFVDHGARVPRRPRRQRRAHVFADGDVDGARRVP